MPPITPPNACGASADPSRLAQQSLRAFWSWTPFAPLLGLKSPWLDIWGPQLRAFGVLSRNAYAPGMAFSGPKAPQVEEPEAARAEEARPAPRAKAPRAPKAEAAPEAAPVEAAPAEAAPVEVKAEAAPVKAEPRPKKLVEKEPPKAAKDLFEDHEPAAAPVPPKVEPSLTETFSAGHEAAPAPAPEAAPAAPVEAEAAAPAAPEAAPVVQPEALGADDLTLVEGVGPATARRLQEQGVRRFADLASLTPERLIEIRRVGTLTITEDQARGIISSAATLARPH
ncbi:helix-hairpin-helix domain-containing protein [Neomegalonema sp.]|uniref:helix-hairpin-helix domain-containing protein n=1 Tax=Neomegalonema sp. TaxID=2039713 RepID=UPI00261EF8DF|nr:helix-hairpin-helix domain-containing protein [Neomegalonema sp.]MDD2869816.1 helix-hairpin-helix domain-containing protein [Neomegalonema sp.]